MAITFIIIFYRIICFMLEPEERFAFQTPQRHSDRHKPFNNTTTAIGTKFNNYSFSQSPSKNVHQTM